MKQYYKVARPDGFDFHTANTINYRENIGKTVSVPNKTKSKELCSSDVLHASELFFDALGYGQLPCSIYIVKGNAVSTQSDKVGFKKLKILREINIENWQSAYHKFMIWMLEDLKNNFDNEKEKQVAVSINQTIKVFTDALKTGKIDKSAVSAAWSVAWSAAWSAEAAARSAESAWSVEAAWSAKKKQLSDKFIEFLEATD